jgi:hypothetical protein
VAPPGIGVFPRRVERTDSVRSLIDQTIGVRFAAFPALLL